MTTELHKPTSLYDPLLTIKEAAQFLKVHPETIRRWYLKLGLKGYKVGKTLRFMAKDLLNFMEHENIK